MKIIFMGSPDFALPTLTSLIESEHEIVACFTQPARHKNRGKKIIPTNVEVISRKHNIQIYNPENFNDPKWEKICLNLKADFIIVVAYGLILPESILNSVKYKALNLHPSDLPLYRGAAPLQRTIIDGHSSTQICVIEMAKKLDSGNIYMKEKIIIDENMDYGKLHDLTASRGAKLILKTIKNFANIESKEQNHSAATYAKKITREEEKINPLLSGKKIINLIKALSPYPGAYITINDQRIKIFAAQFLKTSYNKFKAGDIDSKLNIYCLDGIIKPQILQKAGKARVNYNDFINGFN